MKYFQTTVFIVLAALACFAYTQEFDVKEGLLHNILPLHDDYILSLAK